MNFYLSKFLMAFLSNNKLLLNNYNCKQVYLNKLFLNTREIKNIFNTANDNN